MFSGVYSDPSIAFPFTVKQVLTDVLFGSNDFFSMYKLNEEEIIIGYSKNPLKIQRINYNLELVGGLLQIGSGTEYIHNVNSN